MTIKRRSLLISLIVLAAALTLCVTDTRRAGAMQAESARMEAQYITADKADRLKETLQNCLNGTELLGVMAEAENGVTSVQFQKIAKQISQRYEGMDSLILAPGGVTSTTDFYSTRQTSMRSIDLFHDASFVKDAEYAMRYRTTVVMGPSVVDGKSNLLIVLRPVYVSTSGGDNFWGFTVATVSLDDVLDAVQLDSLSGADYVYELERDESSRAGLARLVSSKEKLIDPVESSFSISGGDSFTLRVAKRGGWVDRTRQTLRLTIGIGVSLMLALLVYLLQDAARNSFYDNLTGLRNRRSFSVNLETNERRKRPYAVIFLDLNHFKQINDTYGHNAGDDLLRISADRLAKAVQKKRGLRCYRVGGDEFTVLVTGRDNVDRIDEWKGLLKSALNRPAHVGTDEIDVSTAMGSADTGNGELTSSEVVKKADSAMYANKVAMRQERKD